jgi:radical SAM protein with 4Fe4S-binding SPASM domain
LRLDPDGSGILMVNASRIVHLNPTAALMTYLCLEKSPEPQAIRTIQKAYSVSKAQARLDYREIQQQLNELVRPDGACPVHDLHLEITAPFSARPSAPYRMDLALTYRCNNDCAHCYNPRPTGHGSLPIRCADELTTAGWKETLDRLWDLAIPHILFTGGEPTLHPDLPELIAYAQSKGQITGLNTNGRRLSDPRYVDALVEAGLDHVQITLESHDPAIHDAMVSARGAWKQTCAGIRNALNSPLFVMTNTTLLKENSRSLSETLDYLAELGIPTIGFNALIHAGRGQSVGSGLPETQLPALLTLARQKTEQHRQRLIWYTPTEYCRFDPTLLELGVKGCTAALYNMCIEPNGDVLPCQSYYQPVGNLMKDDWRAIWDHPLCIRLRERRGLSEKCTHCALLSECGGGCPLIEHPVNETRNL